MIRVKTKILYSDRYKDVDTFEAAVQDEIKRLIRVGAYSGRDWPRELGPLPDELRSKRDRQ